MALTELECLERRKEITERLDADGCHYGDLLSRTLTETKKKLMSKVASFELVAQLMLDLGKKNKVELEGVKKMAIDAIACTHAAQQVAVDMALKSEVILSRFDRVTWKLLWMILGGVIGGNGLFLIAYIVIISLSKR